MASKRAFTQAFFSPVRTWLSRCAPPYERLDVPGLSLQASMLGAGRCRQDSPAPQYRVGVGFGQRSATGRSPDPLRSTRGGFMDTVCAIPGAALAVDRSHVPDPALDIKPADGTTESTAVLAGGCFWCTEGVFTALAGVLEVTSGYSGGTAATANYDAVCSGTTDHAEAIRIRFDPRKISFGQLLKVFFAVAHDPTQVDRQGNDAAASTARPYSLPTTRSAKSPRRTSVSSMTQRCSPRRSRPKSCPRCVLRCRALSPELCGAASGAVVHCVCRAAEGRETARAVRRTAEGRVARHLSRTRHVRASGRGINSPLSRLRERAGVRSSRLKRLR